MIVEITSKDNHMIKFAVSLKQKKNADAQGLFLAEGQHFLMMAIAADMVKCVFATKKIDMPSHIAQYIVKEDLLKKLSQNKTANDIVFIGIKKEVKPLSSPSIIYLDAIQDPGNVGTILRTALAFGYYDIMLSNECASAYNFKTIQASQGAITNLNVVSGDVNSLLDLQKSGYKMIVTSLSPSSIPFESFDISNIEKYVVVFGNEARGVNDRILKIADYFVKIDMDNIDSLNVAIAAGIILNKWKKRRKI